MREKDEERGRPGPHIAEATLNDYVDGELDDGARAAVREHLAGCPTCAADVAWIGRVRGDVRALPRAIEPPPGVREGIRARLNARSAPRWSRRSLLVAAVALVALTASVTRWAVLRSNGAAEQAGPAAAAGNATSRVAGVSEGRLGAQSFVDLRGTEDRYRAAIGELERAVLRQPGRLSPTTLRILRQNLEVIDGAIAESRAALVRDPGDAGLGRMVLFAYDQKLELLRRARDGSS